MEFKIIAYKCGMMSFFEKNGTAIPVTVIKIYDNYIIDVKKINEYYSTIQISAKNIKEKNLKKSIKGMYEKNNIKPCKYIETFKIENNKVDLYIKGNILSLDLLKIYDEVNITSKSKGKGFTGTIKRHNFKSQKASHGNSLSHRAPGSIGQCQTPGRVFKGKKMAGRLGNTNITKKNIKIVEIYNDLNVILLKGSVPGANGNKIIIKKNAR